MSPRDDLRVGDADRDRVVERLREHAAAGRLDAGELEQRVEVALRARTFGELAVLEGDLPERRPRPRAHSRGCSGKSLREHAASYAFVNAGLIVTWAATGFGYPWFIWPLAGWGIGLLSHAQGARGRKVRSI